MADRLTTCKPEKHLEFPFREGFVGRPGSGTAEPLRQSFRDAGRDVFPAAGDRADGPHEFLGVALLVEIPIRAEPQEVHRVVLLGESTEDQNGQIGRARADGGEHFHTTLVRHREVHHHHVDLTLAHDREGALTVGCLGNHEEIRLVRKKLPQPGPDERMIVDYRDANHDVRLSPKPIIPRFRTKLSHEHRKSHIPSNPGGSPGDCRGDCHGVRQ